LKTVFFTRPSFYKKQEIRHLDQYSLGILLYFLHTKTWPYKYTSHVDQLKKELLKTPIALSKLNPAITPRVEKVVQQAMAKDPDKRFETIKELYRHYLGQAEFDDDFVGIVHSDKVYQSLKNELREKKVRSVVSGVKYAVLVLMTLFLTTFGYHFYMTYLTEIPMKTVPNILGVPIEEAQALLNEAGLHYEIAGTRATAYIPQGFVMESKPPGGRDVKENRVIRLFISKGSALTRVPDLTGRSPALVTTLLEQRGLTFEIDDEIYSEKYQKGMVVAQHPTPNVEVQVGDIVTVIISKGLPATMSVSKVPNVFFMDRSQVRVVKLSFEVLEGWSDQEISVIHMRGIFITSQPS